MRITRPGDLTGLASLGLTLADSKQLLAGLQREIVAAQARIHAVRRPECRGCGTACRVKDYRPHAIATLFGQVIVRLPRFRCAGCGTAQAGVTWPPHARSTPELDRMRAQLSALMTYRTGAEMLAQMFPVDSGAAHETLRRHTFKVADGLLSMPAIAEPATPSEAIVVTLDSTFIRSCGAGERHLEVRIGNVETAPGRRQVFGAVAKTGTDLAALIRRSLDAVGRTETTVLTAFSDGCPGLRRILAGGCGMARPRMPGSASIVSTPLCIISKASATAGAPPRPRASCGPPCVRSMITLPARATGWSTTPSGTEPGSGSARR